MKKENRKLRKEKQSKRTLDFSVSQRVKGLLLARNKQKNISTLPVRIIKNKRKKIVIEFEQEQEVVLFVEKRLSFLAEFKKLFFGVLNSYFRLLSKTTILFLVVAINWVAISSIGKTFAYYNDIENSNGNYIAASNLDFKLHSESDFKSKVNSKRKSIREISIYNKGEMDMNYRVYSHIDDSALCSVLNLRVMMNGLSIYSDSLADFYISGLSLSSKKTDSLRFELSLKNEDEALSSAECSFDLIFKGRQQEVDGFSDREIISNLVQSEKWKKKEDESECQRRVREMCQGDKECEELHSCHHECEKAEESTEDPDSFGGECVKCDKDNKKEEEKEDCTEEECDNNNNEEHKIEKDSNNSEEVESDFEKDKKGEEDLTLNGDQGKIDESGENKDSDFNEVDKELVLEGSNKEKSDDQEEVKKTGDDLKVNINEKESREVPEISGEEDIADSSLELTEDIAKGESSKMESENEIEVPENNPISDNQDNLENIGDE